jgi:flagellar protein FliT
MNTTPPAKLPDTGAAMNTALIDYYQAIERASQDMLEAARTGNWDQVLKLTAVGRTLGQDEAQFKSRIMQRILVNDAQIRRLAEPWLDELDELLAGHTKTMH